MMLKWVNRKCLDKGRYICSLFERSIEIIFLFLVKFVMKTDDDMFVVVPNLVHFLLGGTVPIYNATCSDYNNRTIQTLDATNRMEITENLLIGRRRDLSHPIRKKNHKWFMPHYMYNNEIYPTYISGAGYVMSIDVVVKLFEVTLSVPLLHLEDLYLTGI